MKKIFILIFLACLYFQFACHSPGKVGIYYKIAGFAQGTSYHITYEMPETIDLQPQIDSILKAFDHSLSSYDTTSVISKINRNEEVLIDDLFTRVFIKSEEVFKASGGLFDITVMPLVNAWGFGPGTRQHFDSIQIDSLLDFVGMGKVKIVNKTVIKTDPRVQLDVNAIAQGYSVDIVSGYLDDNGSKNYIVEIGGEIRAKGVNMSGQTWRVGIDRPEFGNVIPGVELAAILQLKNKALATSGDYRKYFEENGVKFAHHIDPKTGYPARQSILSATIAASDCITADAFGTVCMVGGLEKSKEILAKHPELEAYLIYTDDKGNYQLYITEGMKKMIVEENQVK
jgi:thiamine biosynthesis lipoprotein